MKNLIRFDWAMKKLLRSKANFGILEGFLSELLNKDVKILDLLESESNKDHDDDKFNRVDLLAKVTNDEIVLIEVQVDNQQDYVQRMLYGTSKIITQYINEGEEYYKIKKIYSVNILYFDIGHGKDYIYYGSTRFIGMHEKDELELSHKQQELYKKRSIHEICPEYYLIKVNQFNDLAKTPLDQWIYFLKNEEIENNFNAKGLKEAKRKLLAMKLPPKEKAEYEHYLDNLRYANSVLTSNYDSGKIDGMKKGIEKGIKKGIKQGMKQGEKLGIKKGEKIGIEKGEKIGVEKGIEKMARGMKEKGLELKTIADITGLSLKQLEQL